MTDELENKIKHFDEIRKNFIDNLTDQMSNFFVPPEQRSENKISDGNEIADDEENPLDTSTMTKQGADQNVEMQDHSESDDADEDKDDMDDSSNILDVSQVSVVDGDASQESQAMIAKINTQKTEVNNLDDQVQNMESMLQDFKSS